MALLQKEKLERTLSGSLDLLKIFSTDFLETSQSIKGQLDELERKEKQWEELEKRIQQNTVSAADLITLDVGGKLFKTSKQTLLRVHGTYFHAMLGLGCWQPDGLGNTYFLDLDPTHFDRIMMFLRTGHLSFDGLNTWECRQLRENLDYLNISTPRDVATRQSMMNSIKKDQLLAWNPHVCSASLLLIDSNRTVQKLATGGRSVSNSAMADAPVMSFSVRLDEFPSAGNVLGKIFIGFAPKSGFGVYSYNPESCGYYIELRHGYLYGQDGVRGKAYSSGFKTGDMVTVRRGIEGDIHFEKNDQELGEAYRLDPALVLYPVVTMYYHSAQLTLL